MDIFLEVASGLRRAHGAQFFDRGFQQFHDVVLNLFPQTGILQGFQQIVLLNVGESATQRTLDNVVVDH